MQDRADGVGQLGELGDGLQHAGLVVRVHHRDQRSVGVDRCTRLLDARPAVGIHADARHAHSVPLQPRTGPLRRRVLDRRRDDVSSIVAGFGHATDGEVVGLGASGREDHLVVVAAEQRRHLTRARATASWARRP